MRSEPPSSACRHISMRSRVMQALLTGLDRAALTILACSSALKVNKPRERARQPANRSQLLTLLACVTDTSARAGPRLHSSPPWLKRGIDRGSFCKDPFRRWIASAGAWREPRYLGLGLPPGRRIKHLARSEDAALVNSLIDAGCNVDWSSQPRVVTSARTHARATGGFADALSKALAYRLAEAASLQSQAAVSGA